MAAARPELRVFSREPPRPARVIPDAPLGMAIFIGVELMLFGGFISAHTIVSANYPPGAWPPPDQPRLPIEATALTTLMLLISGAALWRSGRQLASNPDGARAMLTASLGLGGAFVGIQGFEWVRLIAEGLTLQSSPFGSFFYVIVGAHALHAVPALIVLGVMLARLRQGTLDPDTFTAARMFWYFVVLVWPVLYATVYL